MLYTGDKSKSTSDRLKTKGGTKLYKANANKKKIRDTGFNIL